MATLRQDIMDAVVTRMQGILTTASPAYHTNLGSNVITGRPRLVGPDGSIGSAIVEASELPCILIRDPMDEISNATLRGKQEHRLSVEIEIRCEGGTDTDEDLRIAIADIYAAIGTDTRWSGLAMNTAPVSDESTVLQGDKIIGAALIRINISFITSAWAES
jgi:hypothetical protein